MGRDVYEKVSKILLMHKNADSEPEAIHESLKTIMGKNRRMKDLIFSLEMIIFKENWQRNPASETICNTSNFCLQLQSS